LALVKAHSSRPEEASFFSIDAGNVTLTGMKRAEDGNELIVRLAEVEGKATTFNLTIPLNIVKARRLNLIELPLVNKSAPEINGRSVKIEIRPKEIITLGLTVSTQ
jgi:alpha-mannosidase